MKNYLGLRKKIQRLKELAKIDESVIDPVLLIPEQQNNHWVIEGIAFDTENEALDFAEKLKTDGFSAVVAEILKEEGLFDDVEC